MGTFKSFTEWLADKTDDTAMTNHRVATAVSKSLNTLSPEQAIGAVKGTNQQAQKKVLVKSLTKPAVKNVDDVASVVGIKTKNPPQFMGKK